MLTDDRIQALARELSEFATDCRRTVHAYAELGGKEYQTAALVRGVLDELGLPWQPVAETGALAVLDTGRPGPCVALRADLDALPVPECPENLTGPRTCRSADPATSHACGHDAHTAMLLAAAKALCAEREALCGQVLFCFEPGEENGIGSRPMLAALAAYPVDTCWAIHVYAGLEQGKLCLDDGPRMAGAAGVEVTVKGKGGHGSRPDLSANPVFCAAAILTNVATAWVNQIPAGQTVTLGVTGIQGGETANVIPETSTIFGSLRFFDHAAGEKGVEVFKTTAEHTAAMNGCSVEFGPRFQVLCSPVRNDPRYAALARAAAARVLPAGAIAPCEPWYASESYSRYCAAYPSVMAHLGIADPARGYGAGHHNERFDLDEAVLPLGVAATLAYVAAVQADWAAGQSGR